MTVSFLKTFFIKYSGKLFYFPWDKFEAIPSFILDRITNLRQSCQRPPHHSFILLNNFLHSATPPGCPNFIVIKDIIEEFYPIISTKISHWVSLMSVWGWLGKYWLQHVVLWISFVLEGILQRNSVEETCPECAQMRSHPFVLLSVLLYWEVQRFRNWNSRDILLCLLEQVASISKPCIGILINCIDYI